MPQESDVLTEEQKKQLGELQLFKNKESSVSIEVCLRSITLDLVIISLKILIDPVLFLPLMCR